MLALRTLQTAAVPPPATEKKQNIAMKHRYELNVHIYVERYDKKRFTSSIDPLPTPQKHFTVLAY